MNAVDAFSAQMRNMGYSGGPTPTPPSWPTGAPAYPSAPVQPAQPVGQPQQPANQGYWYALPAGNPDRLTVAQVVAKAYKLDATRDATQIQQISDYVAQQNGVMLSNWPIPNNVTGLRLPWAPTNPDTKTKVEKPKKKGPSFGQIVAGIGAVAAGVGRIVVRHNGQDGVPTNTYGVPGYGQPGYTQPGSGNRDIDNITGDIADVVPILANLGAIFGGNGAQPGYGQIPYGQPGYGQPTYGQPGYYPPNGPSPIPTGTYQPTPPVYQQPQPYNPPVYQPPVYQQPQPYRPPH